MRRIKKLLKSAICNLLQNKYSVQVNIQTLLISIKTIIDTLTDSWIPIDISHSSKHIITVVIIIIIDFFQNKYINKKFLNILFKYIFQKVEK